MTRAEYDRNRRRHILRLIASRGPLTRAEVQAAMGLEYGGTVRHMTSLERFGHLAYDPESNTFNITNRGLMRMSRRNKNSPATGSGINRVDRAGVVGPTRGGGPVVNLADAEERLVWEFAQDEDGTGDAALLLHILRDEVALWERAKVALAVGWPAPPMRDVPRYRRLQEVERSLDAWDQDTHPDGCSYCGTVKRPTSGYAPHSYLDNDVAAFHERKDGTIACRWCQEALAARGADGLRRMVFNAVAGVVGSSGVFGTKSAAAIPFAHELGTARSVEPWSHLTDTHRTAMRSAATQFVHPAHRIRTVGQRDAAAIPGLEPPIHYAPTRPDYVPPNTLSAGPSYREKIRAAEKRHDAAQQQFKQTHPPAYLPGGAPWSDEVATKWFALLETQRRELVRIDKEHATFGDGRPRPDRPHLNPLAVGR